MPDKPANNPPILPPRLMRGDIGSKIGDWILSEITQALAQAGIHGHSINAANLTGSLPTAVSRLSIYRNGTLIGAQNALNFSTDFGVTVGTGPSAIDIALGLTGVTPGVYGDSTHYPVLTVDEHGLVTAVSLVLVSAGSGTVTSVSLTMPTGFSVSGSPITTSGILAISEDTQLANLVKAGPASGSPGIPGYRALVAADLPDSGVSAGVYGDSTHAVIATVDRYGRLTAVSTAAIVSSGGTVTSVALTMPTGFSVSSSPVTGAGTLAVTENTQAANLVKAGPTTGSPATPGFRALVNADLPNSGVVAGTYGDATHVPVPVLNAKGLVTSISTVSLSIGDPGGLSDPASTCGPIRDDFVSGGAANLQIGALNWGVTNGATAFVSDETNHPGVIQRSTGLTNGTVAAMYIRGNTTVSIVTMGDNWEITWILRLNTNDSNTLLRFGMSDNTTSLTPSNGVYVEKLAADTSFTGVTRSGAAQTRTAALLACDTLFHRYRLRRVDPSTVGFSVDGGTEVTATLTIPTAGLIPFHLISNSAAAVKTSDIDYFHYKVTGLVR